MALHFAICGPTGPCEEGTTVARDCATAERFIRAGLRRDQALHIHACVPWASAWEAGR